MRWINRAISDNPVTREEDQTRSRPPDYLIVAFGARDEEITGSGFISPTCVSLN